jgi:hypothetical protein
MQQNSPKHLKSPSNSFSYEYSNYLNFAEKPLAASPPPFPPPSKGEGISFSISLYSPSPPVGEGRGRLRGQGIIPEILMAY